MCEFLQTNNLLSVIRAHEAQDAGWEPNTNITFDLLSLSVWLLFFLSSPPADVERDETPTQVCVCLSLTGWWSLCWWMIKYSRQTDAGNNWFSIIHIHYSTVVYIDLTCHQCTNIHLFTSAQAHLSVTVALNVQRYSTILHNSELYYTSELHSAKQQAVMHLHYSVQQTTTDGVHSFSQTNNINVL